MDVRDNRRGRAAQGSLHVVQGVERMVDLGRGYGMVRSPDGCPSVCEVVGPAPHSRSSEGSRFSSLSSPTQPLPRWIQAKLRPFRPEIWVSIASMRARTNGSTSSTRKGRVGEDRSLPCDLVMQCSALHHRTRWGSARAAPTKQFPDAATDQCVSVRLGNYDPLQAIEDELTSEPHGYRGIIISTLPHPISHWLHLDLPAEVGRRHRDLEVRHVVAPGGLYEDRLESLVSSRTGSR